MKPPYEITAPVLRLLTAVSEKLGEVKASYLNKPSPQLRKQNKIKTIYSSLKIEGNTLTEDQITALMDNKWVIGPKKDVLEVLNAIKVYENIDNYDPVSSKSFLSAHQQLMEGLIDRPGQYRTENVGIVQGSKVAHLAQSAGNVHFLMSELFEY
ncbi:MAG: Fic family protein, partial [Lewinellaceae bacterium]|nr:Fic family protein [Lewinellaceae bacterium]